MSSPLRVVLLPILLLFGGQAVSAPLLSVNGRATGLPVHVTAGRLMVDPGRLAELTGVTVADGVVSWFDNTVRLAPAQHKTQATGDKSLCNDVDLRAVAQALGWRVSASEAEVQVWGPGASVLGVRQGQHADRIRVVLDLSGLCVFQTEQSGQTITLLVPPGEGSVATAGELRLFEFSGERAARVTTEVLEDGWTKVLVSAPVQGRWRVFTLADPPRIVVDLVFPEATEGEAFKKETAQPPAQRREAKPEKPESGGPGRQLWRVIQWPTDAGPAYVHVVTVDPVREVEIRPALAGPVVNSLASVPAIAKAHGAIAAINGGFFSPRHGVPLGMLVINGEWLRAPLPERPVLAIMRDGRCEISRVRWEAWLHFTGLGSLPVLGLNQNHWERDSIVVYTHRWADTVPGVSDATRLIVSSAGRVIFREKSGRPVPVPAGGMVISGVGRRAESLCKVPLGCQVKLSFRAEPRWTDLLHAVGGGPLLVSNGKAVLDPDAEGFRADVSKGRNARSAVGILSDGKVVLVAVEGRPNGRGPGLTLWELTKLMLKLGAVSAMNLDGGSSTTLVVYDRVVTACAGGVPRLVNNALVVVPRSLQPKA